MNVEKIVEKLTKTNKTISVMESCSGGGFSNLITNVSGSSLVFKFGAVTYSNEFKIKMGVPSEVIDKYSVYSLEVARCMAKAISDFTGSVFGLGITGKLGDKDPNNLYGDDNKVFFSIYDRDSDAYYDYDILVDGKTRAESKDELLNFIISKLDFHV